MLRGVKGGVQEWQKGFIVRMVYEFIDYGNHILCPCFDYCHKKFLDPDEYLYRIKNMQSLRK